MKKLWFSGLLVPALSLTPGVSFAQTQVKVQKAQAADKYELIKKQIKSYNSSITLSIDTQEKIVSAPKMGTEDKINRISKAAINLKTARNNLKLKLRALKLKNEITKEVDQDVLAIFNDQLLQSIEHKDLLADIPQKILALINLNHVDLWRMDSKIMSELEIMDELIEQLNASISEQKALFNVSDNQKIFNVSVKQIDSAKNISDRMISLNTTVIQQNYDELIDIAKEGTTNAISNFLTVNITRMNNEDKNSVKLFEDKKLGTGEKTIDNLNELDQHFSEQQEQIDQTWTDIISSSGHNIKDLFEFERKFIKTISKNAIRESLKEIKETLNTPIRI